MHSRSTILALLALASLSVPALAENKPASSSTSTPNPSATPANGKDVKPAAAPPVPNNSELHGSEHDAHAQQVWKHHLEELFEEEKHAMHRVDALQESVMHIYPWIIKLEDHLAWMELAMERQRHRLEYAEHELHKLAAHRHKKPGTAKEPAKEGPSPGGTPASDNHEPASPPPDSTPTTPSKDASSPSPTSAEPGASSSEASPSPDSQASLKGPKDNVAEKGNGKEAVTSTTSAGETPTPAPKLSKRRLDSRGSWKRSLQDLD